MYLLWLGVATVNLAEARVGGGRSSGSRGSHSMSSPRPAFTPPPPSPSRPQTPPSSGLTAPGRSRPAPVWACRRRVPNRLEVAFCGMWPAAWPVDLWAA